MKIEKQIEPKKYIDLSPTRSGVIEIYIRALANGSEDAAVEIRRLAKIADTLAAQVEVYRKQRDEMGAKSHEMEEKLKTVIDSFYSITA
jgi:uncharacterized coiled-coil DUF342 family protein